ncbi:MAG: FAD-binding and (Fe-S)-binding domain-containing protein [Flavobacteriaceae bacterium]|nr:FAD-binding and (Fe-S)-binding domain-containing protein [Flavobacteriaceae bacterium]
MKLNQENKKKLNVLKQSISGELHCDHLNRILYATDASVYKKLPLAVCFPKTPQDIQKLIHFADQNQTNLIPRTAGTSLAGQCVGDGIVVDMSKHFNKILRFNKKEKTVVVQPGVIRDQLNLYLKEHGLFFSPNTSTSNFCMIGGMVGNNSCGTTSIKYGVTRDKVVRLNLILSDGQSIQVSAVDEKQIIEKKKQENLEGKIYRFITQRLSRPSIQEEILKEYPSEKIHRRNTGYAIDELIKQKPFNPSGKELNLCQLLSGSEGTLGIVTEIEIQLDDLPPKYVGMIVAQCDTIIKSLKMVPIVMEHELYGCELVDKNILDCTRNHPLHQKNRFFLVGDPQAILMLEMRSDSKKNLDKQLNSLKSTIEQTKYSYANTVLLDQDVNAAISLRTSGLGLLGNIIGDKKSAACIEDTAVSLEVLPRYIQEFQKLADQFNQEIVYYAHAGAGELHLRPLVNLKTQEGKKEFRQLTKEVALLVKKYNGSLSGEHGDGIVRSEFISLVLGEKNYSLLWEIKQCFDPKNIFNPGKIIDSFPMDQNLRTQYRQDDSHIQTKFNFNSDLGLLRALERCNGAGNCRSIGPTGTLCPSYRATQDEVHTTRGRANVLREAIGNPQGLNPFDSEEIKEVLDLCLSCKACISECPSSVDMATYKAEFSYQYYQIKGYKFRDKVFAHFTSFNKKAVLFRGIYNRLISHKITSQIIKKSMGIATERSLPKLHKKPYFNRTKLNGEIKKEVYLYIDEFTYFNEPHIAKEAYELLMKLGYGVEVLPFKESGRTYISKGFLDQAKSRLEAIFNAYGPMIHSDRILIGIEPSAVYTFQDELLKLLDVNEKHQAFSSHCVLMDSFLAEEFRKGDIDTNCFHQEKKTIKFHAHCYQKALGSIKDTFDILNMPSNYQVSILNTGCCGMAGSFGYEKEHYEISMRIGNDRLFPAIQNSNREDIIVANGTSCRHQILDGTKRKSYHPISVLLNALK